MIKIVLLLIQISVVIFFLMENIKNIWCQSVKNTVINTKHDPNHNYDTYTYPKFYKGIYLNIYSARNIQRLSAFAENAKKSYVNTLVLDIQHSNSDECMVPAEHVDFCIKRRLHPIARIVVFPNGLKKYPVSEEVINKKINLAKSACKNGFKEIQFDYIRFNDHQVFKNLSLQERYEFIEGFLYKARINLQKYDVKIAADIFGRIPLNSKDTIGQRMEGLDKVVDIICPMAYPSHYSWSRRLMADPYYTVFITSKSAKDRTKNAEIVTYIQAFKMKLAISKLPFEKYIEEQVKAVHDSEIRGYILWNASQNYDVPFNVLKKYYQNDRDSVSISNMEDREQQFF